MKPKKQFTIPNFLDISEADLVYTETIMARGKEDYTDKDIVILGKPTDRLLL